MSLTICIEAWIMNIEDLLHNKQIKAAKDKAESNYQQAGAKIAKILAELKTLLNSQK